MMIKPMALILLAVAIEQRSIDVPVAHLLLLPTKLQPPRTSEYKNEMRHHIRQLFATNNQDVMQWREEMKTLESSIQ